VASAAQARGGRHARQESGPKTLRSACCTASPCIELSAALFRCCQMSTSM
jgi:hypothetical protein